MTNSTRDSAVLSHQHGCSDSRGPPAFILTLLGRSGSSKQSYKHSNREGPLRCTERWETRPQPLKAQIWKLMDDSESLIGLVEAFSSMSHSLTIYPICFFLFLSRLLIADQRLIPQTFSICLRHPATAPCPCASPLPLILRFLTFRSCLYGLGYLQKG